VLRSLGLGGLASLAIALQANAASHLWRFSEFYSSPDKQIQFIEMQEIGGSDFETNIQGHWYATNSYNQNHAQLLGTPLPFGTANKKFLVGTVAYAALPGVPAPDYILPNGILEPSGDTIVWWFYQTKTIPPATMPSDGVHSLTVIDPVNPDSGYAVTTNSPTNFAGVTGRVLAPGQLPVPASSGWGTASLVGLLLLATWAVRRQRASR
jgi:hypothetical protein